MNFNQNHPQNSEPKNAFHIVPDTTGNADKNASIYKKTEKVAKALFLVTQHLSDTTPLKKHVRDSALSLLDVISQISFASELVSADLSYKKAQANRLVTFTLSLTELAAASGLMSFKNSSIITDNIVSYKNELVSYIEQLIYQVDSRAAIDQNTHEAQIDLSHSFFEIESGEEGSFGLSSDASSMSDIATATLPDKMMPSAEQVQKGQSLPVTAKDSPSKPSRAVTGDARVIAEDAAVHRVDAQSAQTAAPTAPAQIQELIPAKSEAVLVHKFSGSREGLNQFLNSMQHAQPASATAHPAAPAPVSSHEVGIKNERQQIIVDTIRAKGELSIKDLTDVITDCSEKTIQRELISLVSTGFLHKTGERRWSKYSLALA
ncbi:MAG TPA: hypothetical protein VGE62_03870 [Candidatus Paceibacterota bacterium]